jgi:cytochrome c nitrite reductase small subunit
MDDEAKDRTSPTRSRLVAVLVLALGVPLGVGGFTLRYAEGLSYLSSDPAACRTCHIMRPQYDSWLRSSHHNVAVCVDCHLPHGFLGKYVAKAENGYHHSKGFTLQDFHEPVMVKAKNAAILQENCLRCHAELTHELVGGAAAPGDSLQCAHCHASAGHGEVVGLGGMREKN